MGGRSRSRARSRSRSRSVDWSRRKGKSDAEMIEELRSRLRENAVCGQGKVYAKRPLTFDASMSSTALPDPAMAHGMHPASRQRRHQQEQEEQEETEAIRRRRKQDEDERAKNLHNVYQKYCASSASAASSGSGALRSMTEAVDRPDVLRL